MELRHLRYFLAVAEEGQFTRAAERLGIQQPPLSQQIRLLELQLGFALFERLPRGVVLTPAGEGFARDAGALLVGLQQAIEAASRVARGEVGTLSIGLTSSASFHSFTTDTIRRFRQTCPEVALELTELNAAEVIERLASGLIDVAFLRQPVAVHADLHFDRILDEPMVVVLPVGHRLLRSTEQKRGAAKGRVSITLKALADENFVLVRRPGAPGMYADILAACRHAGFVPRIAREVPGMLTGINLVAAGFGVTLVPASMQRYDALGTVYCDLKQPAGLCAPLHLAYPKRLRNGASSRFIEQVAKQVVI
jgi:DNA-binding transcriptional LysR family regulator